MSIKTALPMVVISLVLMTSGGAALAQEIYLELRPTDTLKATDWTGTSQSTPQLSVDHTPLVANAGTVYSPQADACVCTNLNAVTVICEDCDRETRVDFCHTHDRACQDAALLGGIREHDTFFCTTLAE